MFKKKKSDPTFFLPPLVVSMTPKVTAEINNLSIINLEHLVETLGNILRSDTSDEMTFFQLSFFEIGGKFEWFCLIWGIYGKCATLLYSFFHYSRVYSNKNESC